MIEAVLRRPREARRRVRLPRLGLPPFRLWFLLALAVLAAVLGGLWLWLRDSSLVAVTRVTVAIQDGPDAGRIRSALIVAAHNMTTLHVRVDALRTAVAPYPVVKDLRVETNFPHGMRIRVIEQVPVGAVTVGGRTIAVAADGTLLRDSTATQNLALIALRQPPGGPRLTDPSAMRAIRLLAAAPYQLLARVSQLNTTAKNGFVVQLRGGPGIYFGDGARPVAKWTAASEVLADPSSAGAAYVDVTNPERPAAGGGAATAASGAGSSGNATSTASTANTGTSASTVSTANTGAVSTGP
jgi:cell division protein FtsQ